MNEEKKKAIETVENFIKYYKKNEQTGNRANLDVLSEEVQAIKFILNEYDMQQKEIEQKEKMIELMVNLIYNWDAFKNYGSRKDIKQYFENLAKESGEIDEG